MSSQEPGDIPVVPDPEEAATQAAMEELARMENADVTPEPPKEQRQYILPQREQRGYAMPHTGPIAPRPVGIDTQIPQWSPAQRPQVITQPNVSSNTPHRTLEDLYAALPDIGDGSTYLRIVRVAPLKDRNGSIVSGTLPDVHEKISMDEFVATYGGNKYTIYAMGPGRGGGSPRTLAKAELTVPGPPGLLPWKTDELEYDMAQRGPIGRGNWGSPGYDPQVEQTRLKIEAEESRRRDEEQRHMTDRMLAAQKPPEQVFDMLNQQHLRSQADLKSASEQTTNVLRESLTTTMQKLADTENELRAARSATLEADKRALEAQRYTETEQIRQLKEKHDEEMKRREAEHSRVVAKQAEEHRAAQSEMATRHVEERARYTAEEARERERLREDVRRREEQVTRDADRQVATLKETHTNRVADLERQLERETNSLTQVQLREIESIRSLESSKANMAETTAKVEGRVLREQIQRLESERDTLKKEVEDLRAKNNKDLVTQISEAHTLAGMTGMISKDEAEAAGAASVAPEDWKSVAGGLLKGIVEKLPEAAQKLGEMRNQNAQDQMKAQQQMAMMQHQQAVMAAQQEQQRMLQQAPQVTQVQGTPTGPMAPKQPPRGRNIMAPPPAWQTNTAIAGVPASVVPAQSGAPNHTGPTVAPTNQEQFSPMSSPIQVDSAKDIEERQKAEAAAREHAIQVEAAQRNQMAAQQAPQAQAPEQQVLEQITPEMTTKFIGELDAAIGVWSAKVFAQGLIEQITAPVAASLLGRISPQQVIDAVEASNESAKIGTYDGKKYVFEVWAEAEKILREKGAIS